MESTTKVFLSHLHADHIGDIPGLLGSLAKAGRVDPVEVWGGGNEDPALGLAAFVHHMGKVMAWDTASVRGVRPTTGFEAIAHEIPYDRPDTIYDRNGVIDRQLPGHPRAERGGGLHHQRTPAGRSSSRATRAPAATSWRPRRAPTC